MEILLRRRSGSTRPAARWLTPRRSPVHPSCLLRKISKVSIQTRRQNIWMASPTDGRNDYQRCHKRSGFGVPGPYQAITPSHRGRQKVLLITEATLLSLREIIAPRETPKGGYAVAPQAFTTGIRPTKHRRRSRGRSFCGILFLRHASLWVRQNTSQKTHKNSKAQPQPQPQPQLSSRWSSIHYIIQRWVWWRWWWRWRWRWRWRGRRSWWGRWRWRSQTLWLAVVLQTHVNGRKATKLLLQNNNRCNEETKCLRRNHQQNQEHDGTFRTNRKE